MACMKPTKYDPETAPADDEGLFYNGEEILSVHQYQDDDDCDYEAGYISIIVAFYNEHSDEQYGDANYYGYKSVADFIEGEMGFENLYRIAENGYDCGTLGELWEEVGACEGIDLFSSMRKVKELIGYCS